MNRMNPVITMSLQNHPAAIPVIGNWTDVHTTKYGELMNVLQVIHRYKELFIGSDSPVSLCQINYGPFPGSGSE